MRLMVRSLLSFGLAAAYQPALRAPCTSAAASSTVGAVLRRGGMRMMAVEAPSAEAAAPAAPAVPIKLPSNEDSDTLLKIRHTSAHVMAMAVQRLFGDTKVTIGPWIEKGFYYDFDRPEQFAEKDLRRIKKEMDKIIKMKLPLLREEIDKEEAERRIKEINEPYKLEILESIVARDPDAAITIYHIGGPPCTRTLPRSRASRLLLLLRAR
jgi:threonyl-tRNA synthetase